MSNTIQKTASNLLALINDSEKICLPIFANKLARASETYPEDQTIGVMASVVEKMSDSKLTITRKELKDLYSKLYSRNTKFATIFKDELGLEVKAEEVARVCSISETSIMPEDMSEGCDPVLANALASAFGDVNVLPYSKVHAERAVSSCSNAFSMVGLSPTIKVENGTNQVIVCRATFETPKGSTSVLVPVQFIDNRAVMPTGFVANTGVNSIDKASLQTYLTTKAGEKLTVDASFLLKMSVNDTEISNVDLAITKLNASREKQADLMDGNILGQKVNDQIEKDVQIPEYQSDEITAFAKQFDTATGIASFKFGQAKVKMGRDLIDRKLSVLGVSNYQISVFDATDNSILYAVSMNNGKVAFRVPVKIEDGKVFSPNVLISNGSITDFSNDSINELCVGDKNDYKAAAVASVFSSFGAQELVEAVISNSNDGNYDKAEEALNVLNETGNKEAYAEAFEAYCTGLKGVKTAKSKCSMVVKSANSQHLLCGHTGLPLHKVHQNKMGECVPEYRKNMSETYDASYLQDHKIYL